MPFNKPLQIKYWQRCLHSLLPSAYTSNDSNRLYLAFMIISALDLLSALPPPELLAPYINFIYTLQHPGGGFRMFSGTDLGGAATAENAIWDPAHVPATFFALATLVILRDDLERVRRDATLSWLRRLQRQDGSFGETLHGEEVMGGRDTRFAFCVAGVRYLLGGGDVEGDVDVDGFVRGVQQAEESSWEGVPTTGRYREAHAGYLYTTLGALGLFGRLNSLKDGQGESVSGDMRAPILPLNSVRWLVNLQAESPGNDYCAGISGRPSKPVDTCYAFWVSASLEMLHAPLYDRNKLRNSVLDASHEFLGGFAKTSGEIPDLYHSYLGLAALGVIGTEGTKDVDPVLCVSRETREKVEKIRERWKTDRQP
ncbi:terpenoid cyclases/Protein prenyltransferase [Piedraia hortae CBS 480.64]|uniref:Terpenoid cyclases/Protein prenyltransferase n=1 Tax=Piedraia hortae CBS 480.64 TaxID=1314780 RepID=A0A6A7C7I0_9PEZI|nr:terpenoid cyclases/Protein prenyltransferase [Piedraia hortae CBS 480.64]